MNTIKQISDIIEEAKWDTGDNDSVKDANVIHDLVLASLDTPELRERIARQLASFENSKWESLPDRAYTFFTGLNKKQLLRHATQILALITKPLPDYPPELDYPPDGSGKELEKFHSLEPSWHHQKNQPESYEYVNNCGNI